MKFNVKIHPKVKTAARLVAVGALAGAVNSAAPILADQLGQIPWTEVKYGNAIAYILGAVLILIRTR